MRLGCPVLASRTLGTSCADAFAAATKEQQHSHDLDKLDEQMNHRMYYQTNNVNKQQTNRNKSHC